MRSLGRTSDLIHHGAEEDHIRRMAGIVNQRGPGAFDVLSATLAGSNAGSSIGGSMGGGGGGRRPPSQNLSYYNTFV